MNSFRLFFLDCCILAVPLLKTEDFVFPKIAKCFSGELDFRIKFEAALTLANLEV